MANTPTAFPAQVPNIDLPGAEYFALQPNRLAAIGGRRARSAVISPAIVVAANSVNSGSAQVTIEAPFPANAAIYIHDMWAMWVPADQSGQLTIGAFQMGFGLNPANPGDITYRVGIPLLTQLSPNGVMQMAAARDILLHKQDLQFTDPVDTSQLVLGVTVTAANKDAANPHSFQASVFCFYTRLDGLVI